ncbi:hypothetical protein [Thauera sp.]|uniref:hypothetical protein n=1 Tax=Thauera sp. TaxID=1905334 RepID=UPI002C7B8082|nr:hypothetical protein [Thauera sp.]HRP26166.1 hypothetical protein [Thauera sp.]
MYEIQDTEINNNIFILELEINNLFFFKLNNNVFDFLKTFFFFKKKEIFFFYINCIEYLFNEYIIDFFFYKIILSFSFFFSFFINKKFNIYNYGRFFFCKNELFFNKYTLPIKTNYFKKINRRKLRIKFPKFNKNKLKFKKLYKLILKSFFITFKKFNLNDFFKNINSTYGFMSLNFFFLFMNSIFVEEHLVDFDHLFWDLTTHINRNVILNRLSSNTMNVEDYYIYNSHLPVLTTDLPIKQRFLKSVETLASLSLNKFHQLYFISFFESLFKKKFFVRFESNFFRRYKPETAAKLFIKGYQNFNFKILRNLHTTEFLEIIWYSFQFRDLRLLNNWLKKIMPMVKLKDHKKLIACMKLILENNSIFFRTTLGVNGFFFKIKGKISVTGNAKKRSSVIRFGNVSLSSKYLKLEYEEGEINTRVGILGYKMFLCY